MKRNLIGTLSLAVLSLLLTATGAYAQSMASAYVPFAFQAGKTQLPAGHYLIKQDHVMRTVEIRGVENGAFVLAQVQQDSPRGVSSKVVFHHVGNQYFLAKICGTPDTMDVILAPSKQEKQLRMLQVASGPTNNSEQVLIALK